MRLSSLFSVPRIAFLFLMVGFAFALSGCWNKNYDEPGRISIEKQPTEVQVTGGFQRTWAATQSVLAKFPISKKDSDVASNRAYIVTDWIRGKSDVLYHGFDVNRMPYVIRYKLYVYLSSAGGRSVLRIKSTEQYLDDIVTAGVDVQGSLQSWVKTESSTLKENSMLTQIQKLVSDPKFDPAKMGF